MLRPGGRVAYYVIHAAPGLSRAARDRAIALGPSLLGSRLDPVATIEKAGFTDITQVEVTDDFLQLNLAIREAYLRYEVRLRAELGNVAYEDECALGESASLLATNWKALLKYGSSAHWRSAYDATPKVSMLGRCAGRSPT